MSSHEPLNRAAALVLFCRKPVSGAGKRRLAQYIGDARTLAVAQGLLECALEDVAAWPHTLIIAPAAAADEHWAAQLICRPVRVVPQPAGSLGERIAAVDTRVRAHGCTQVLFIGSDAPSMRSEDLLAAHAALADSDVVLIPAADGGVTLMGARVPWPELTDLPWSEATLGAALADRCLQAGHTVTRLQESYDVDTPADLILARQRLQHDPRPARRHLYALLGTIVQSQADAAGSCAARGA